MRPLTISSFSQARDNHASRVITDLQELVKEFENPKILEEPATEALANQLKPLLPAWSPATYRDDARANENVERASCLVFDLDGKDKAGLDPNSINPPFAYAIHSTTRSGFCQAGNAKLRLVIPLAKDVDASTYQRLWKHVVAELGIADHVDGTRLHPGGIFFTPAIFAEHKDRYVFRANLELPWLDPTPKRRHKEFEDVAKADAKDNALFKAAASMAARGVDEQEIKDTLIEALQENARRGSSSPVEDWNHAENTIANGWRAGQEDREINALAAQKHALRQQHSDVIVKEILKRVKSKELTFESAARHLREFQGKIDVKDELYKIWKDDKKAEGKYSEFEAEVQKGLATEEVVEEKWKLVLDTDAKGRTKANRYNISIVLKHHAEMKEAFYNVRSQLIEHPKEFPWGGKIVQAHHGLEAAHWVAVELGSGDSFNPAHALQDLSAAARKRSFDPFIAWIEKLSCEPDDAIYAKLCVECLGAEPTEYHLSVLRWGLILTLARQFRPGTKADYMPILEGKQGIGKSTFLRELFPVELQSYCFGVMRGDVEDRGNANLLSSCVILEMGELSAMYKKDIAAFKQWLTIQEDKIRPLFSNVTESVPRRAVCWGTTNDEQYLKDTTGNRRFWPITITKVDFNWLTENREKLWKTVHKDWLQGVRAYPTVEESERLFAPEQERRREADALEELVLPYLSEDVSQLRLKGMDGQVVALYPGQTLDGKAVFWTTAQLASFLGLDQKDNLQMRRLKDTLRKQGWESKKIRCGEKTPWSWKKI